VFTRLLAFSALLAALAAAPSRAAAQGVAGVVVGTPRTDSAGVADGDVVTVVFPVFNPSADSARVVPAIHVPAGWTAIMGTAPFTLAPGVHDTWLVSLLSPAHAAAGAYVMHADLVAGNATTRDSVVVQVRERHGLDVVVTDVPRWTMAGDRYEAQFLVRNTGNVADSLVLKGSSSRGVRTTLDTTSLILAPGASTPVRVTVQMTDTVAHATNDVVELLARSRTDTALHAMSSGVVAVVPARGGFMSGLATIPAQLSLRAVNGAAGLAPALLTGSGTIPGSNTQLDFTFQAPAAHDGPHGFGERQQYQLSLTSDNYRLKLGDQFYGYSALTSGGGLGTGAEFDRTGGILNGGAYVQQPRFVSNAPTEEGFYFGTTPRFPVSATAALVTRQNAVGGDVRVASFSARGTLPTGVRMDFESALSDSASLGGHGNTVRLGGNSHGVDYNAGYQWSSGDFAGPTRGSLYKDAHVSYRAWRDLTLSANASLRVGRWQPIPGVSMSQRLGTATITAGYAGVATLEYGVLSRRDESVATLVDGVQRGLRATGEIPAGPVALSVVAEHGVVADALAGNTHGYSSMQLTARTELGNGRSVSVYTAANQGSTLGGVSGMVSGGMNAQVALPNNFEIGMNGSAQRQRGFFSSNASWLGQMDAHLDYRLPDRSVIGAHIRMWQSPTASGSTSAGAFYLEYRTPVGIPTGPSRQSGRAFGRVVDEATGAPVPGALVHLGAQAAVSDDQGRVKFSALPPAVYHVSLDAAGAAAGAMLTGDVVVDMRHQSTQPVDFRVAVARGGEVVVAVNRYDFQGGTLESSRDSLVAVAPLPNVLVALATTRDTLYQTTDSRGLLDFTQVAPGHYTLSVLPDNVPEHYAFETREVSVVVQPGATHDVKLRLVPQRRVVNMVDGGGINLTLKPNGQGKNDKRLREQ
jgi:hypothetical protein